jgi:hypothetical protein
MQTCVRKWLWEAFEATGYYAKWGCTVCIVYRRLAAHFGEYFHILFCSVAWTKTPQL